MPPATKEAPVRAFKLTPEQIAELMGRLDSAATAGGPEKNNRAHERIQLCADAVIVRVEPGDVPPMQFVVAIRNISEGGVAFLHNAMLSLGMHCTIYVLLEKGRSFKTTGKVVRCRHLQGMIHEVGLKFDSIISLDRTQSAGATGN